jgi:hypothetical protein
VDNLGYHQTVDQIVHTVKWEEKSPGNAGFTAFSGLFHCGDHIATDSDKAENDALYDGYFAIIFYTFCNIVLKVT